MNGGRRSRRRTDRYKVLSLSIARKHLRGKMGTGGNSQGRSRKFVVL
jgi:hypothetical protein